MTTDTPPNGAGTETSTGVLGDLVGDGKKFKTVEDLAVGKLESDSFIRKVTDENAQLRQLVETLGTKVEALATKAAFLDRLGNDTPDTSTQNQPRSEPQTKAFTEEDALSVYERRDAEKARNRNTVFVDSVLLDKYGAEAKNVVRQKADEIGMDLAELVSIGQRNPTAFFNLIGVSDVPQARNPSLSGRVAGTPPTTSNSNRRNHAFYKAKEAEVGAWQFATDKGIQLQMHRDMKDMGDSFFE